MTTKQYKENISGKETKRIGLNRMDEEKPQGARKDYEENLKQLVDALPNQL